VVLALGAVDVVGPVKLEQHGMTSDEAGSHVALAAFTFRMKHILTT
jgi:hypothetical protein